MVLFCSFQILDTITIHKITKKLSKNHHPMFRPLSGPHAWLYLQTYRGKLEFLIPYASQFINHCPLTLTKKTQLKYHTNCILSCSNASPIESLKHCPNTLTKGSYYLPRHSWPSPPIFLSIAIFCLAFSQHSGFLFLCFGWESLVCLKVSFLTKN